MDTKAAFEKWFDENYGADYANDDANDTGRALKMMAWQGWQASRAAIEIELPEGTGWASDPYNHGRNNGINQCAKAITSHGIRIKGKTE